MLSSIEDDALAKLDTQRKNTKNRSLSFAEAIQKEIDILQENE
jgi:hypothetical protein